MPAENSAVINSYSTRVTCVIMTFYISRDKHSLIHESSTVRLYCMYMYMYIHVNFIFAKTTTQTRTTGTSVSDVIIRVRMTLPQTDLVELGADVFLHWRHGRAQLFSHRLALQTLHVERVDARRKDDESHHGDVRARLLQTTKTHRQIMLVLVALHIVQSSTWLYLYTVF